MACDGSDANSVSTCSNTPIPNPNPPGYGASCTSASNACGATNTGTIQCNGACSATTPADPSNYGVSCTSSANACSQTNTGTIQCNGTCSATAPANPPGYGAACSLTSSPNACSQTTSANTGTIGCSGTCTGTPPSPPPNSCTYTITASAGANGSVVPSGATTKNYGTSQTYTITPAVGYSIASVLVDSSSVGAVGTYTFSNITANHTISATFVINTYTVSATAGAGGTISPASRLVTYGSNTTFTVTPSAGYTASATGCGGSLSGTTYTTGAITGACTVSAAFALNSYALTISKAGAGSGTVTSAPSGINCGATCNASYNYNTSVTLTALASGGSAFSGWSGDADCTDGSVTVNSAKACTATFTALPDLTITDPISPQTATEDAPTVFSTIIRNIGLGSTGASFNNFMQVATNPNGGGTITDISPAVSMPALAGNSTGTFSKSYTFASNGSYSLRVCADKTDRNSPGVIVESNDNNNCGGWENIVVSSASCANGANNYPTCNTCTLPLVWNGSSCVACNGGCGPGPSCNNGATNPPSCSIFTPTATLSASPSTIDQGQSSTLSWNSTNATSCTGTGFSTGSATVGNVSTGPLTQNPTNYSVTCTGSGGSATDNESITVLQPTASISGNPTRAQTGTLSQIIWSASQVNGCTVSGPGLSSSSLSGAQSVQINSQSTFTITCATNGSPVTSSVTVNVIPLFQEF